MPTPRAKQGRRQPPKPDIRTVQYRKFKGMNLVDARVAINDDEFTWIENAITIGNGAIQLLPTQGATLATVAAGISSFRCYTLVLAGVSTPVAITVNTDGSMTQVNLSTGAQTAIGGAGTVSTAADTDIWQASTILIIDPTTGYKSWNGAALTVIDATKTGVAVAVFEGRAWIARSGSAGRTIEYSAPNTFNSFVAGDGAGSTIITDSQFPGNIVTLRSSLEQLWVLGQGAVETIANVVSTGTAPTVVTTFSITNILAGLGTNSRASVIGYFRALTFASPSGIWALSGVTPQKLSEKIDGMQPALTLGDAPAALATIQNYLSLCFLVTYTQSLVPALPTPASGSSAATKLVLVFNQGEWFVATQGALTWISTGIVNGVTQTWGTDGSTLYQLFGGGTSAVAYKVQSKLYDFGLSTTMKGALRFGFEYQGQAQIDPTITLDNESSSQTSDVEYGNAIQWTNNNGTIITWTNNALSNIQWIAEGMVLARNIVNQYGRYLGWTVSGTDAPYRIQAIQMEILMGREWSTP